MPPYSPRGRIFSLLPFRAAGPPGNAACHARARLAVPNALPVILPEHRDGAAPAQTASSGKPGRRERAPRLRGRFPHGRGEQDLRQDPRNAFTALGADAAQQHYRLNIYSC